MGKIRVKSVGEEEQKSAKELKKEQAMAEAKKAREAAEARRAAENGDEPEADAEEKAEKKETVVKKTVTKSEKHSDNYAKAASHVEKNKQYKLDEAVAILAKLQRAKFDETVELHINTNDKGISGSVTLPHGTGKDVKVVIANASEDMKAVEELVKSIESGKIEFDVLIATPDTMPKLAKVARVLGPRGLMPNPKNGTVTPKPADVAAKFAGGQVNFKTEAKHPVLHMAVGKVSFGDKKLIENIKEAVAAVKTKNVKNLTLASTMSPGIKVDVSSLN